MAAEESRICNERVVDPIEHYALARRVRSAFLLPPNREELFEPLTTVIAGVGEAFKEIERALKANLDGLISSVCIPYTLAYRSTISIHWQRILRTAGILSLTLTANVDETSEQLKSRRDGVAFAQATHDMNEFVSSKTGKDIGTFDLLHFLDHLLADDSEAANELILQGVVLCWGAFEVLARDTFVTFLNLNPRRTLALLNDSIAKRRFELSKVSLETLANHDFDLSSGMGTLLAEQQDLSDVVSVKAVFQALFGDNSNLRDALNHEDLRLLSLRRNLIVHRRGIIDEKHATSTHCSQRVGQRLKVAPGELETHLHTIVRTSVAILDAAKNED
jgi:hypothetical protein